MSSTILNSSRTVINHVLCVDSVMLYQYLSLSYSGLSLQCSFSVSASVIVAEVTQPSLGVGYELGRAVAMNKRILCLFRPSSGKGIKTFSQLFSETVYMVITCVYVCLYYFSFISVLFLWRDPGFDI